MNNTSTIKRPFPIAAFFFIAYSALSLFHISLNLIMDIQSGEYINFSYYVTEELVLALPLVIGIFLLVFKKPAIIISFLFVSFAAIKGYMALSYIDYLFDYSDDLLSVLTFITEFMIFIAVLLACILFIIESTSPSKKKGILSLWFLSPIISGSATLLYYVADPIYSLTEYQMTFDAYISSAWLMFVYAFCEILLALALGFLCFWLYKYNRYASTKEAPTPNTASYNGTEGFQGYAQTLPHQTSQQYNNLQRPIYAQPVQPAQTGKTEEIERYQKLLNEGAITPEEYEIARKRIFGM